MTTLSAIEHLDYLASKQVLAQASLALYRQSITTCNIDKFELETIDTVWTELLNRLKAGTSATFIKKARTVIQGTLKFNGIPTPHSKAYSLLHFELRSLKTKPVTEYSEGEVKLILKLLKGEHDIPLFNAVVLQALAGLRVSSCKGLRFENFRTVPEVPDVRVFDVTSKGANYTAAISEYGFQLMVGMTPNQKLCVYYDEGFKTPFADLLRSRLHYLISKYNLHKVMGVTPEDDRKSIFHSFRHWFITACAATLHSEDVSLLAGHVVSSKTAYRFYVKKGTKTNADYEKRVATCYSQTPLMRFRLEEL